MEKWTKIIDCIPPPRSQHRSTHPVFWATTLLCDPLSSRTLSSLGQSFSGRLLCSMNTLTLTAEHKRKRLLKYTELCWQMWPWSSFTTTKLSLGAVSQVEPGYGGSRLRRHKCLTVFTCARVLLASLSPK